jgi:hypothetical protein
MTKVYILIQFIDGEVEVDVYAHLMVAMAAGEELASTLEFEEEDKGYWTCPDDSGDYIDIQVKELQ